MENKHNVMDFIFVSQKMCIFLSARVVLQLLRYANIAFANRIGLVLIQRCWHLDVRARWIDCDINWCRWCCTTTPTMCHTRLSCWRPLSGGHDAFAVGALSRTSPIKLATLW